MSENIFNLGARRMSGLVGDVAIPALDDSTATYWVAESGAPTEGAPTVRQITMSPKSVGAYVDLSRRLMLQSDPSADGFACQF
jgi:HK97 family phage major capsid protein